MASTVQPQGVMREVVTAIATRVRHARQTTITVARSQARAVPAAKTLAPAPFFSASWQKMRRR